ncbi:hypothetical protein ACJMK2_009587 [Sinanodonta woodiana]|uniref:Transporter n=1 Tax=Sinanodonta woodiana TaxID=1069815 RepID=A0ABD3VFM5_SINWO
MNHIRKEFSNGVILKNGSETPPGFPPSDNNADGNHSLLPDQSDDLEKGSNASSHKDRPIREDWGHKADFLLAVIGYAVDLSNVWRFPYLCYRNGGGAFIIPYFTVLILGALPIFFMEMSLGQFHREGPVTVWKIVPICKGIGYASCFMAYIVAFYYNVVIGWSFFYLFSSFTLNLPWGGCNNSWNTENCWSLSQGKVNVTANQSNYVSSTFEYFERGMLHLHLSKGVDDLGSPQWQLVLCTLLTFTVLYFSLWKGVKSSGKVWIDAAVQIMFSVGCGFGTHIAYASYNKFNNNCYRDCIFTATVNSFTSIFSGFVVFSYLGYMAERQHKDISKVAQEGPGLVFIVYPEAISTLPGSTYWSVIFFLMLITLGMDSAFGGLESPLTGLQDQFYRLFKYRWSREVFTFVIVFTAFFFALPCTTSGGMYVFKILDTFAAGTSIIFTVLCQVLAVSWLYGVDQFCDDIQKMIGHRPGLYWRICWKFVSPTFLAIIVISSILHYTPLAYEGGIGTYIYPEYANILGWFIAASSMSIIPIYAVYKISSTRGSFKEFSRAILCKPVPDYGVCWRGRWCTCS